VKNEVESLQKDILEMKSNIQKIKEKSEHYEEDLVQARKESEVLAKQNDAWEAKIASREEYLAKHHKE
jgi:peptidoglycan hydrolase CwlO-like protein